MKSKTNLLIVGLGVVCLGLILYFQLSSGPAKSRGRAATSKPIGNHQSVAGSPRRNPVVDPPVRGGSAAVTAVASSNPAVPIEAQAATTSSTPSFGSRPGSSGLSTAVPEGEPAVAKVNNRGATHEMVPNEIGYFPRVYIEANQVIPVEVSFPEGKPNDPVVVHVEDGGTIDETQAGKLQRLDSEGKIAFKFKANSDLGIYRVVLRKGADLRVLEFWVGEEQQLSKR